MSSTCGLTCCPSRRASFTAFGVVESRSHCPSSLSSRVASGPVRRANQLPFSFCRSTYQHVQRSSSQPILRASMDASFENVADNPNLIFPGINIRDPYKRLGISREASEEEIQAARNYLINKYAGHKPSVDAIEFAHDKIIMQKFYERKNPKINFKKKIREVTQSPVMKVIANRFETPSRILLMKTTVSYLILGLLTLLFPTDEGPTLQVALSLIASIYFINDRLRSLLRGFLYGVGAFIVSWFIGTFLMVSVIPPLFHGQRSLEVSTSLLSYILLWVSSSYLK